MFRTRGYAQLAALASIALMAIAAGSASAGRLSVSNQGVEFTFERIRFEAEAIRSECDLTLQGSFHNRTLVKMERTLIGFITAARLESCRLAASLLLTNLPWHLTYESFAGTLPNITSIVLLLTGLEFTVEPGFSVRCLSGGSNISMTARLTGGATSGATINEVVPLRSGGGLGCPVSRGTLNGTGSMRQLNNINRITITLI